MQSRCLHSILLGALLISTIGCAPFSTLSCSSTVQEKKSLLGDVERDTTCNCTCPKQSVVETGGIIGGIASFFKN